MTFGLVVSSAVPVVANNVMLAAIKEIFFIIFPNGPAAYRKKLASLPHGFVSATVFLRQSTYWPQADLFN
jgi:hypothetical protein